jgi:hypothetical protein
MPEEIGYVAGVWSEDLNRKMAGYGIDDTADVDAEDFDDSNADREAGELISEPKSLSEHFVTPDDFFKLLMDNAHLTEGSETSVKAQFAKIAMELMEGADLVEVDRFLGLVNATKGYIEEMLMRYSIDGEGIHGTVESLRGRFAEALESSDYQGDALFAASATFLENVDTVDDEHLNFPGLFRVISFFSEAVESTASYLKCLADDRLLGE